MGIIIIILIYFYFILILFKQTDKELEKLLTEKWVPLIDKFNGYFETNLKPTKGIYIENLDTNTRAIVEKYFLSLGFPALHGLYNIIY